MEKINFKNSRGLTLVGDFYSVDSDSIVIMMHGFTGDRHEGGKFDRAAEELNKKGYAVLNFDFSGAGESDDDSLTVDKEVVDANCAIQYAQNKGFAKIGLLGMSLGGLVAAKVYDNRIKTIVFWAPVTQPKENPRARYTAEQLQELDEKGHITYTKDKGFRKTIIIDKQMLEDRTTVDTEKILSHIKCPVLIIHGDADTRVPLEGSKKAMQYLPLESRLVIIPGANHTFENHSGELISTTVDWFKKYL
ncbi:alpha/beta fold hydrolase [Candidatus Woesearchaeota archaeon]|nr:alpha/beta fold hydrolase [Candidatus Woesearchaeota archaeon]